MGTSVELLEKQRLINYRLMKNLSILTAALLIGAAVQSSCTSLEVTLPKGPQGEQGIQGRSGMDGLSSYDVWVKAVSEGGITGWDGERTSVSDYFIYL